MSTARPAFPHGAGETRDVFDRSGAGRRRWKPIAAASMASLVLASCGVEERYAVWDRAHGVCKLKDEPAPGHPGDGPAPAVGHVGTASEMQRLHQECQEDCNFAAMFFPPGRLGGGEGMEDHAQEQAEVKACRTAITAPIFE